MDFAHATSISGSFNDSNALTFPEPSSASSHTPRPLYPITALPSSQRMNSMSTSTFIRQSQNRVDDHSVTVNEFLLHIACSTPSHGPRNRQRELSQPNSRGRKKASRKLHPSLKQRYGDQFSESNANTPLDHRRQKNTHARKPRARPSSSTLSFHPMTPAPHTQVSRPLWLDASLLANFDQSSTFTPLPPRLVRPSPKPLISIGTLEPNTLRTRESNRRVQSGNDRLRKSVKPAKHHSGLDGLELVSRKEHEDAFNRLKNVFNSKSPESYDYQQCVKSISF